MSAIPCLSLSPPPAPSAFASALESYGFLQLSNPPISLLALTSKVFDVSKKFFEEEDVKEKERCRRGLANAGWVGNGVEKLDVKGAEDLKEAFNIHPFTSTPKQPLPSLLAPHAALLSAFMRECHSLCMQLLESMALSLDLPKEFFTERHGWDVQSGSVLRLLYYPGTPEKSEPLIRAGAHSDYGSLTLLFQQTASGLQVLLPEKDRNQGAQWLDVPASPSTVLVNVGDLMEAWTGGRWPSTVHRVIGENSAGPRLSIAYFLHPADEVKLHRIRQTENGARKGRKFEEGMTSGEWLARRLRETYTPLNVTA